MRHRADLNQRAIVTALRAAGRRVLVLSQVGDGCFDLLAHFGGTCVPMEVKQYGEVLTPMQVKFHSLWTGPKIVVVHDVREALAATGICL